MTKLPHSRIQKIRALLASPNEGERLAAEAALARISDGSSVEVNSPPKHGSKEWLEENQEWDRKIEFAISRIGVSGLTPQEMRTVRNLYRYRGYPWSRGADEFLKVYRKIVLRTELD